MPKKRRKLSPEMEKDMASAKRKVELITAIINDIEEEDIQGEYLLAFEPVKVCIKHLTELYLEYGINDESQSTLNIYNQLIQKFESEYEL